jgi:basic membrane protein A
LSASAALAITLVACQPAAPAAAPAATTAPAAAAPAAAKLRVKLVINGNFGDKSFFDSAKRGLDQMASELGYEVKTVELGTDANKWEPGLEDAAANDDYDILITGTFQMPDYLGKVADKYPNKKFWLFDAPVDYAGSDAAKKGCKDKCKNVYSILFRQNEGSYVLGYAMGLTLKADALKGVEGKKKVGVIGGLDIPVINDFYVGFKQGFKDAGLNPDDVLIQYVGGDNPFFNPAKGKEIAKSMYAQGAALVWGVAGASGNGAFEAAVEDKTFALGVDSDQYLTIADPAQKATIVTSMLKNVDNGLFRAAKLDAENKLGYGAVETVGVAGDAVGIAQNENYKKLIPADIQKQVDEVYAKAKKGEITFETAFK